MKTYKTSWEMYNNMSDEHREVLDMPRHKKISRCSRCRNLNQNTFSYEYCEPCSNCIGGVCHSTCIDEDYYEYANWN